MNRNYLVIALFVVAAISFLGSWLIAVNGDFLDSSNFNAWLAAGGFFATVAFVVERAR